MTELRDRLADHVSGRLHGEDPELARRIDAALENDPTLRAEHDALVEAFAATALVARPVAPAGRGRLLAALAGVRRFDFVLDRFAALFDVDEARAHEFLHTIDEPASWRVLLPGIGYRDFEGGPATAGRGAGIVRVAAGLSFPHHRHVDEEHLLVLAGVLREESGARHRPGDLLVSPAGSAHTLVADGDEELVYAVVVGAIRIEPKRDAGEAGNAKV